MAVIYLNEDDKYNHNFYEFKIRVEREMEIPFVLDKLSPTYCLGYNEVNLIDLIFLNPNNFETRAFELKVRDWKGVVYQAKKNLKICNYSSIVMPYSFLIRKWDEIKQDVIDTKIGVFGIKEGWFRKGTFAPVSEFKKMKKTQTKNLIMKVRQDYAWLRYYVPTYKKYSGGFLQMYKKVDSFF